MANSKTRKFRASECEKIEENIFSMKLESKSLRGERRPLAEEIASTSHSSGSPNSQGLHSHQI
jgi:hypothetical protein